MKPTGLFIDLHKALVIPVTVAAMLIFGNFSTVMWLYLAMHGTYSILWLIKGRTYPTDVSPSRCRSGSESSSSSYRWPGTNPPQSCWPGSTPD